MKIAYFDCFAGAAGDMILGALVDAGLDPERLKSDLASLELPGYHLEITPIRKSGLAGTKVDVILDAADQPHRGLAEITRIIEAGGFDAAVRNKALRVFRRLAEAEAKVHGTSIEEIHFHEVGAVDAIVDVVGAVLGLAALEIEAVYCSPMHVGSGTVTCAHGVLPVPAPATAELLRGVPCYSTGVESELLTPTGAAILTELSRGFGPMPAMIPGATGYGAGNKDFATIPNLLRVTIGEALPETASPGAALERVAVLETGIDDMNPQIHEYVMERLLEAGALDVFFTPIQMKKNRPAVLLTVICEPARADALTRILIEETTTIGARRRIDERFRAERRITEVATQYGPIRVKIAEAFGGLVNASPEYDDCKHAARRHGVPLKAVMEEARSRLSKPVR